MRYLFDTNAVLYELKGVSSPIEFEPSDIIYCSFITKIELLSCRDVSEEELDAIRSSLSALEVLYIDEEIVRNSVYVRQNSNLKLPDAIICATALQKEAVLITADKQLIKAAEHIGVRAKNAL